MDLHPDIVVAIWIAAIAIAVFALALMVVLMETAVEAREFFKRENRKAQQAEELGD